MATLSKSWAGRRHLPIEINPVKITGAWEDGYCLDRHTISSTMIGYNEFGHPEFDTQRSALGELIYRLKYKGDVGSVPPIVDAVAHFIREWGVSLGPNHPDAAIKTAPHATGFRNCFCTGLDASNCARYNIGFQNKQHVTNDLIQSGASMNVLARSIKDLGHARAIYAIALTRTRG